jgi:hypothetical protein
MTKKTGLTLVISISLVGCYSGKTDAPRVVDVLDWNGSRSLVIYRAGGDHAIIAVSHKKQEVLYESQEIITKMPHPGSDRTPFLVLDNDVHEFHHYYVTDVGDIETLGTAPGSLGEWLPLAIFPDDKILLAQIESGAFGFLSLGDDLKASESSEWTPLEKSSLFSAGIPVTTGGADFDGRWCIVIALRIDSSSKLLQLVSLTPHIEELASLRVNAGPVADLEWNGEGRLVMKSIPPGGKPPIAFHTFDVEIRDGVPELVQRDVFNPAIVDRRVVDAYLDKNWLVISTREGEVYVSRPNGGNLRKVPLPTGGMPMPYVASLKQNQLLVQTGDLMLSYFDITDTVIRKRGDAVLDPVEFERQRGPKPAAATY